MVKIITILKQSQKESQILLYSVPGSLVISLCQCNFLFIVCRLSTSTTNAISDDKSHFYSFLKTVSLMII